MYNTVIGIEIHLELKTKTKMFSGSRVDTTSQPNTNVNAKDLAHPGTLPLLNKDGIKKAIMACHALNFTIDPIMKFDRKNYFYSDLSSGYQDTQNYFPIGSNGYLEIELEDGTYKKIRIERVHAEEDTAKQYHMGNLTLIDFNRAGTPLIEIVSKPDISSGYEARKYVEGIREIVTFLGISDGKMEDGSLRCDLNISVNKLGEAFGTRTEVKNINTLSNLEKAVDFEIKRKISLIENGEKEVQTTRRFDENLNETVFMREKESASDYKYIPDPNIPIIKLDEKWIEDIKNEMGELPNEIRKRFKEDYNLSLRDINILINNKKLLKLFEETIKFTNNYKDLANIVLTDIQNLLKYQTINEKNINVEYLGNLLELVKNKNVSLDMAKKKLLKKVLKGEDPLKLVEVMDLEEINDEIEIKKIISKILKENPKYIENFLSGGDRVANSIVGKVMKETIGKANPVLANKIAEEELNKLKK